MANRPINTLVVGGGAAGLWLIDALRRRGINALLIDRDGLGAGQTIASQGIIHGGVKYSLLGSVSGSAKRISRMPALWRRCLAGEDEPNLNRTNLRAEHCHLWHTSAMSSRLGFSGARKALQVTPTELGPDQRPRALAHVPGKVLRLDEQVIGPKSFLSTLFERNRERILSCQSPIEIDWQTRGPGNVQAVTLREPGDAGAGQALTIEPRHVVLTAGQGNDELRQTLGLERGRGAPTMQRRPLHMIVARGALPPLNGHCIDGQKTRVTITSETEDDGPGLGPEHGRHGQARSAALARGQAQTPRSKAPTTLWQIGGQVSEVGVAMEPAELIHHTQRELQAVLPSIDLSGLEWTTYHVDRAEAKMPAGVRPENAWAKREANTITAWPTKLALAPQLTKTVLDMVHPDPAQPDPQRDAEPREPLDHWPRPKISPYPWEHTDQWVTDPT